MGASPVSQLSLILGMCLLLNSFVAAESGQEQDPWEGFNRKVFAFNDALDRYFLRPVSVGYQAIAPQPVEQGVSNFYSNLLEVSNVLNDLLQGKVQQAGNDGARFLLNSTVGVVGLFDPATRLGFEKSDGEDFGQTLAVWGVGQGNYLVLPFFGPSTLRDAVGMPVNSYTNPITYTEHVPTRNTLHGVGLVNTRVGLLTAEKLVSGDKYTFFRNAFLQRRHYLINDAQVEDDFGSEDFGDEDFEEDDF